jgi:copper(I)-binding protein
MLSTRSTTGSLHAWTRRRRARQRAACALAVLGTGLAVGCAAPAQQGPAIKLSSAQVTFPSANGTTDIYLDVRNDGAADQIIGARISVGGIVTLRSPIRSGVVQMRSVRTIAIPARSFVGLDPNGSHLLVTGSGPMKAGTEITLTVVFAHAGPISVPALVTNPESGGSSYFLN